MAENVKEILEILTSCLFDSFLKSGYSLKKNRFFEKVCENGRVRRYALNVSKRKGWFSLHLTLQILDSRLMKGVNTILDKALRDERYIYPEDWSHSLIERCVKVRTSNHIVAELTDWRELKGGGEKLDDFNQRFSVWLYSFDDLGGKGDWKEQLISSVELALRWFDEVDSDNWICVNTDYPALYLLATKKLTQQLKDKYSDVLNRSKDSYEVELFYWHLLNEPS